MYNLHDCCTEHGICSILGRMPNRIKYTSPVYSTSFSCLILLTRLPRYVSQLWRITGKRNNLWCLKKVRAEWTFYPRWRNTNNNWCTDAPAINTEELSKVFPMGTVLLDSNQDTSLFHGSWRPTFLTLETKKSKQLEQHTVKDNELGLLVWWGTWINSVENLLHSVEQLNDDCVQFSALKTYK